MKLLLDTHAFLWFVAGDTRLSMGARAAIEDAANQSFLSAASAWEIAVKVGIGKLKLLKPYDVFIPGEMARNSFGYLPIELTHTSAVIGLPFHHRDPFDRLLI